MQLSTQQSMANDFYKESNGPKVSIVSRSKAPNGVELVTYQLSYWRAIHSELMTHRMLCIGGDQVHTSAISSQQ